MRQLQLSRLVRSALIDLESTYRTVELADGTVTYTPEELFAGIDDCLEDIG